MQGAHERFLFTSWDEKKKKKNERTSERCERASLLMHRNGMMF